MDGAHTCCSTHITITSMDGAHTSCYPHITITSMDGAHTCCYTHITITSMDGAHITITCDMGTSMDGAHKAENQFQILQLRKYQILANKLCSMLTHCRNRYCTEWELMQ